MRVRVALVSDPLGSTAIHRDGINLNRLDVVSNVYALDCECNQLPVRRELWIVNALESHHGIERKGRFGGCSRDAEREQGGRAQPSDSHACYSNGGYRLKN